MNVLVENIWKMVIYMWKHLWVTIIFASVLIIELLVLPESAENGRADQFVHAELQIVTCKLTTRDGQCTAEVSVRNKSSKMSYMPMAYISGKDDRSYYLDAVYYGRYNEEQMWECDLVIPPGATVTCNYKMNDFDIYKEDLREQKDLYFCLGGSYDKKSPKTKLPSGIFS